MDEAQKKRLEEIMASMECPEGCECCKPDLKRTDKMGAEELLSYVTCAEDEDKEPQCEFKLPTGDNVLCSCPVRVHIAKALST
ncbi:MAG: hypothetical protein ACYSTG_01720 [Planctomycetota bacterium]|jgi:hypothetical protein